MTSFRRDPYPWIHLAGFASLPLWLDVCLAGLAVGDPTMPPWLELGFLGAVGGLPILWMQWRRPFYIFSLPAIAIRPDTLNEDRRRFLTLQRTWLNRLFSLMGAVVLLVVLAFLYQLAPIAAEMSPLTGQSRALGWLICALSFLLANLFVQIPVSVLQLLITSEETIQTVQPYEAASVLKDFTVVGLRVNRILPELTEFANESVGIVPPVAAVQVDAALGHVAVDHLEYEADEGTHTVDHEDAESLQQKQAEPIDIAVETVDEVGETADVETSQEVVRNGVPSLESVSHPAHSSDPAQTFLHHASNAAETTTIEVSADTTDKTESLPSATPLEVEGLEASVDLANFEKPSADYSKLH